MFNLNFMNQLLKSAHYKKRSLFYRSGFAGYRAGATFTGWNRYFIIIMRPEPAAGSESNHHSGRYWSGLTQTGSILESL